MIRSVDSLLLKLRFRPKGILLVSIPLVFEILFITLLSASYVQAEQDARLADHGRRVTTITEAMTGSLFALGASIFVSAAINPHNLEARFRALQGTLEGLVNSLVQESEPYPDEAKHVAVVVESTKDLVARAETLKELGMDPLQMISQSKVREARKLTKKSLHNLSSALGNLMSYEQSASGPRLAQAQLHRQRLSLVLYSGVGLNVLLSIWLALIFGKQITNRLAIVSRNAVRMSKKESPIEVVEGADELADLDRLIHKLSAMLIETSRRERAMVDNTMDVICALSADWKIISLNAAVLKQWGWDQNSIIGFSVLELLPAEDRTAFINEMQTCRSKAAGHTFECTLIRQDASLIESSWSVLWSEVDQSFFSIVRDVGEEKELERLRKRFFSMITHDLRTPLANYRLFLQMLAEGMYGELNQGGKDKADKLLRSVDFLNELTNDLLDIGKLQSGQLKLSLAEIQADTLIDECCSVVEALLRGKSIKLTVISAPGCLQGDFLRLKQVLINFLSNAVKFSPAGSTITIQVTQLPEAMKIAVRDQGPGLSEEDRRRIFAPYVQADNQALSSMKGFGLGLSIAKTVIEAHKGSIGVDPVVEGGSEFWFAIPNEPVSNPPSVAELGNESH